MKPHFFIYRANQGHAPKARHTTIESAIKEAERLSEQHPGEPFEILKCVAITQCTKASTFWMDGEESPETPAYRMLEDGEAIENGDEFDCKRAGDWRPHNLLVGRNFGVGIYPTRRPIP